MRVLITGACGFVGSTLARAWAERGASHTIYGLDNFIRPGSELNRRTLKALGVTVLHGDTRVASDFEHLPAVDWVVDAAANPSVLAGVNGVSTSRQLVEHNLGGTINILEYCRRAHAGFVLLSTSRVYSIRHLSAIQIEAPNGAYRPIEQQQVRGLSSHGIDESFPTDAPISLYGATKLASEQLAAEYGSTFDFPVWIDRCGVLAGGGQFGRPDQGIFSFWLHSWAQRRPLTYIGFDGQGHQVRDCLHPRDLVSLLDRQMLCSPAGRKQTTHLSGGAASAVSLKQCSDWCADRLGPHDVQSRPETRPFDIPWLVLDNRQASQEWNWTPETPRTEIFEEIVRHAQANPDWLDVTHE